MDLYQEKYIMDRVAEAKQHLEKYRSSIAEVYVDKEDVEANKKIFLEILGESLFKRIKFIPNQI